MMLLCNRFALVPHLCLECKRYIWLEGYRKAKVWKKDIDTSIKKTFVKVALQNLMYFPTKERRMIMIQRYKKWKNWKKKNNNSRFYQFLVLIRFVESPSFVLTERFR